MIIYLGSSSLIKLYTKESHSEEIRNWVRGAEIVATSRIAYMEVMSALDIRFKKGDLSKDDHDLVVKRFSEDWKDLAKVDFDDVEAGNLVKKYGLTRFGAIHLSAAKLILREHERHKRSSGMEDKRPTDIALFFSSEDQGLCEAAISEGFKVLPVG
jgi:predicted nucleic acid-binding protein